MTLSKKDFNIYLDMRAWLAEDIGIKGRKERFIPHTREHAQNEYVTLVHGLLPTTWEQFQKLRAERLPKKDNASFSQKIKVGKQVMLACSYAEESLAFEAITRGRNPVAALHEGFNKLDSYITSMREVSRFKLPPIIELDRSLDSVAAKYNGNIHAYEDPILRLQTVVGLAIVALHEQTQDRVLLPKPGQAADKLELWVQPGLI